MRDASSSFTQDVYTEAQSAGKSRCAIANCSAGSSPGTDRICGCSQQQLLKCCVIGTGDRFPIHTLTGKLGATEKLTKACNLAFAVNGRFRGFVGISLSRLAWIDCSGFDKAERVLPLVCSVK